MSSDELIPFSWRKNVDDCVKNRTNEHEQKEQKDQQNLTFFTILLLLLRAK